MYFPAILILPIALKVVADGQFKSRPDLSPPRLNITIPASEDVGEDYIFVAPYSGFTKGQGFDGPEQQAGYILRDNGDLVWSSLGCLSGWVGNMQVSRLNGKPVLSAFEGYLDSFHGHGFGHPIILDQHYTATKQLRGGNHKIISIHEFNVLEESSSALVEVYQPTQMDLFPYGGDNNHTWIVDAIFQELDMTTNDVLFEWRSLQHAPPSASMVSLASGHAGDGANSTSAWDYFHINSVDKNYQGGYLISARHASAVYKINGKTGDILWQLGGSRSDFSISDDIIFGFQHDARFFRNSDAGDGVEFISLFDNAARANGHRGGGIEVIHSKSKAKVIRLDTNSWTASLVTSLSSPGDILAPSQGNVQTLPNGNLFVNWGQGGAVTEFRASDGLTSHTHFRTTPTSGPSTFDALTLIHINFNHFLYVL
ncbi:hypothetical protein CKAH01_17027 [Colletotrichum kahawae]|uniref:Arylsulfotransferase n=1 Tax=Colletotrichum kahawae TaxID=34407 RepID=A0AAD9YDM5_COLKA|nr:hypothetical protein CKAH01_17027 [Colletotrichum kahawae]